MEVIVTHTNADFDSLASMVAARKLYPNALLVFPGSHGRNIKEFLQAYRESEILRFEKVKNIDFQKVTRLIVVDTKLADRIGPFKELVDRGGVSVHLYDHHPTHPGEEEIEGEVKIVKEIGATATILVEIIRERGIPLHPLEATIMALGIYEDTGSLTYISTTPEDLKAAAFLLSCGADLNIVSHFITQELTAEQVSLFNQLLLSLERYTIDGLEVAFASASADNYVDDLAILVHKLRDVENLNALFVLVKIGDRIHIVARSRLKAIDVGEIVSSLGGGGHSTAASATVKETSITEIKEILLQSLRKLGKTLFSTTNNKIQNGLSVKNVESLMRERLPTDIFELLKKIGEVTDELNYSAYVVGGFVRDLLLGVENYDIDIVIEGDGIALAQKLAQTLEGEVTSHKRFGTAVVTLANNFKIDVATARTEYYEHPAALPKVEFSSIKRDLERRDFTINAIGIKLNPKDFGEVIDFFGGQEDLKKGIVKVLHNLSFVEDPTRIFRAIRFEQRYNFKIHRGTRQLLANALRLAIFNRLTNQRIREELVLILNEERPLKALKRMAELDVLKFIHPQIRIDAETEWLFNSLDEILASFKVAFPSEEFTRWVIYLLCLVDKISLREVRSICNKFKFAKKYEEIILAGKKKVQNLIKNLERPGKIKPSTIYRLLRPFSLEVLLFTQAKGPSSLVQERISCFIKKLRHIKIEITGNDLKKLGHKPGPQFKRTLEGVLRAKLDGLITTKEEQLAYARSILKKASK